MQSALASIVQEVLGPAVPRDLPGKVAEAVLTAGWRPPPRTVKSVRELDTLPVDTYVLDADLSPWIRQVDGSWAEPETDGIDTDELAQFGPVTVLEEPDSEPEPAPTPD